MYTASISTVFSKAFGSVTCARVIWLYILQPKLAIDLKFYSLMSVNVMCTVVVCDNHCQITGAHVTQLTTVNWLYIFAVYRDKYFAERRRLCLGVFRLLLRRIFYKI